MTRLFPRFFLVLFALAASLAALACESETGPDAPARTNGCIDLECRVEPTPIPIDGDSGSPDGG